MSKLKTLLTAATLLVAITNPLTTNPANAEKVLQGEVCEANVHKLTSDIEWYKSLGKAEKAAAEQNKLIFWLHIVGKIDGAT